MRPPVGLERPNRSSGGGGRSCAAQSLVAGRSWQEFGVSYQEGAGTPSVCGPDAAFSVVSTDEEVHSRACGRASDLPSFL